MQLIKLRLLKMVFVGLTTFAAFGCRTWDDSNSTPPAFDTKRFEADPWEH